MLGFKQALRFALVLLVATSTCHVTATSTDFENQKQSNDATQSLNSRGGLIRRAPPPGALNFNSSQWIWTTELINPPNGSAPIGSRAFRKTFILPAGKVPVSLSIVFAVDNLAVLWVNGNQVANQVGWVNPVAYCVSLQGCGCCGGGAVPLLIAFNATNQGSPAGLLVSALVKYSDNSTSPIVSDGSWRTNISGVPDGFQYLSFDDSTWELAETEGGNGAGPWGNISISGPNPPTGC
ncbi:hypothetical protein GYMLUDRAFT_823499 [Collybiopsis luxurians FD-317 M1]|uniref:Beta-galactosidase n=1 Tax=Collybiopsis luxurians FD-317 M1 TaxID=944289 RepID=A0A0D0CDE4_9AGAR|nr:hypothetical protein GYMLUDRAFT_823499 [Collybiopsis luxurians FD-317 M1]